MKVFTIKLSFFVAVLYLTLVDVANIDMYYVYAFVLLFIKYLFTSRKTIHKSLVFLSCYKIIKMI